MLIWWVKRLLLCQMYFAYGYIRRGFPHLYNFSELGRKDWGLMSGELRGTRAAISTLE